MSEKLETQFLEFFDTYNKELSNYCRAICYTVEDAEDLMGETIFVAFKSFKKLREHSKFKQYIFAIASRLYKKQLRRKKIVQFLPIISASQKSNEDSSDQNASIQVLYRSLRKLKGNQAEIIVLKEVSGFTTKEIGELLNMNENTVKTNLSRAKQTLVELLRNEYDTNISTVKTEGLNIKILLL